MATGDTREQAPAAIVVLAAQVDEMRTRLQQMHADLHGRTAGAAAQRHGYDAAVQAIGAATLQLIDAQARLRAMRVAHRQQAVADLLEQDRRRERQRLWQLTAVVALAGAIVVLLAATGAIATARLAIGIPVLLAGALLAVSLTPWAMRGAGRYATDQNKATAVAAFAVLALIGALAWRPLGYACLLALVLAGLPVVVALRARRRRAPRPERGRA